MAADHEGRFRQRVVPTPLGSVILVARADALTHVFLPGAEPADDGLDTVAVAGPDAVLDDAARQLEEYFEGSRQEFELSLDLRASETTEFERDTWWALATIPYGETISYATQAERIGRKGAFRAVGAANGRNPLPIVLPCHRVLGADGSLVGFGGGLPLKRALLDLESGVQQLPLG